MTYFYYNTAGVDQTKNLIMSNSSNDENSYLCLFFLEIPKEIGLKTVAQINL